MSDGEVKIHISSDADTKGIDEAGRKLDDLNKKDAQQPGRGTQNATTVNPKPPEPPPTSASVSAAGWEALEKRRQDLLAMRREQRQMEQQGDTKGAASVERKADKLERNIDREGARLLRVEDAEAKRAEQDRGREAKVRTSEERRAARERREAERHVTREMREQHGMRRAGVNRAANIYSAGQQLASGGAQAAPSMLMGGAAALANPLVMAAAIAGAVTLGITNMVAQQSYKDKAQALDLDAQGRSHSNRRARLQGVHGSSGALVSSAVQSEDEIAERKNQREALAEKARFKLFDPSTWTFGGLRKNAGQMEQNANEARIQELEQAKEKDLEAARKKFMAEEGGLDLRMLRGRSKRSQEGQREAFVAEMGQEWLAKYKGATTAGADEGTAKEMADLTVQNSMRDRQASAGAGLVDARSGGAEIAAAARWGGAVTPGMDQVSTLTRQLLETVQESNQAQKTVNQAK